MTKIKSKIHTYGNKKESKWPSQFGTGEKGIFHIDKETKEVEEGYPEDPNPKFGTAPMVIFDSMPPTYHEAAQRTVESRKEWEALDKQHNKLTFSTMEEPSRHVQKGKVEKARELAKDRRKASETALGKYRSNPREVKQKLNKQAETQDKIAKKSGLKRKIDQAIKERKK